MQNFTEVRCLALDFKDQNYGCEIEMTGLTREQAARAVAALFGTTARRTRESVTYDPWEVLDNDGKKWRFVYDGSILSNAVNYTEAGQSISVVFDKNKLSVSNECSVLPPEQLQHIFEPFYRPDLAHSQATGGNGLGLYIVQTILDKLRLKYQFVPMPNDRGMSFTIQF